MIALEDAISWESYPQEATSWLAMLLGGVAVLLTTSGMYGVLSYLISQRTREIGIRIALGASRGSVAGFMVSGCAKLSAAGVALGMVLGIGVLRYLSSDVGLLIDAYDVPALAVPLVVVALTVLLAALGPVRRAWHVDPQQALRSE